jgi:hypothetical protein
LNLEKILKSMAMMAVLTVVALTMASAQGKQTTLTGVVSDAACGATHQMKNMSPADCARACAKKSGYALVVGNDVYKVMGHEADFDKYAAETVTVKGTVNGKTVTVDSIMLAKKASSY